MGGFVASALYSSMNEAGNGNGNNPRFYSVSGSYSDGPLYVRLKAKRTGRVRDGATYSEKIINIAPKAKPVISGG